MGINEVQPILEDMKKEERKRVASRILELQQKQKDYQRDIQNCDNKRIDNIVDEFLDQNEIHINELKVLEKFIDFYKSK